MNVWDRSPGGVGGAWLAVPGPALVPNVEPSIFAGISLGTGLITTADIFVAEESLVVKSICSGHCVN